MFTPASDHDLLFGLLAWRIGLLTQEQLLDGVQTWLAGPGEPLGLALQQRGALTDAEREAVERLAALHAARHGGPDRSLASLPPDGGLRERLDQLAAAAPGDSGPAEATSPLRGPGPRPPAPPPALAPAARYRKLREHARGGLGEVSVALDEELGREVALKEIQARHAHRPDFRARFLREAEVTGKLEHPGIVPVYGLGVYPDGRPYYAMRLIKGQSLQAAIDRFHEADQGRRDPSERALRLRALLARFVAVCDAVAYAHSRGVVHRDLKPANVMLGDFGETLVVDWGLAKVLGQAEARTTPGRAGTPGPGATTAVGEALGTPAFMPPEQALGQLDQVGPASDVFALGATLYCLLTGQAPYVGSDVLHQAKCGQAAPARRVSRAVPPPLSAACARAMALRPEDRYGGAALLARDVERWLADEPVSAYREPAGPRLRRWARRHRTLVTTAAALGLAAVAALGLGLGAVSAEQARTKAALDESEANLGRALRAEGEARANLAVATAHLARAVTAEGQARASLAQSEANLTLARQAVDECFGVAKTHPLLTGASLTPAGRALRRVLLEKALPFYENFREQRPQEEAALRDVPRQLLRVAEIRGDLGHHEEALRRAEQAVAGLRRLVKERPEVADYRAELAAALGLLADSQGAARQAPAALETYREVIDLHRRLVEERPSDAGRLHRLAVALNNRGQLQFTLRRHDDARESYRESVRLGREAVRVAPAGREARHALAGAVLNLGFLTRDDPERAACFLEATSLYRRLVQEHPVPDHTAGLAFGLFHLGTWLGERGRAEEALRCHVESARLGRGLVRDHPDVPDLRIRLAQTLRNLAVTQGRLRNGRRQVQAFAEAVGHHRHLAGADPRTFTTPLVRDLYTLARLRYQSRQYHQSREDVSEAISRVEALPRPEGRPTGHAFYDGGAAHWLRAELLGELRLHRDALPDWEEAVRRASPQERNQARLGRALCLARLGEHDRATREAAALTASPSLPPWAAYDAACTFARAGAAISADPRWPLPLRERMAEARARRAIALLAHAARGGHFRPAAIRARLDRDEDLDSLRGRDDYRAWRGRLTPPNG